MSGFFRIARAMATRCSSPPDNFLLPLASAVVFVVACSHSALADPSFVACMKVSQRTSNLWQKTNHV